MEESDDLSIELKKTEGLVNGYCKLVGNLVKDDCRKQTLLAEAKQLIKSCNAVEEELKSTSAAMEDLRQDGRRKDF